MTEEQGMLVSDGESDCGVLEDYTTSMDLSGAAMSSLEEQQLSNMDRAIDHLQALLICENQGHYSPCQNYFQAIRSRQSPPKVRVSTSEEEHPSTTNTDTAFSSSAEETTTARLNECWRTQLCEWCYELVDHLGFDREVVSIAFNYLDRFIALKICSSSAGTTISKKDFQLIAVACFYTAIKVHGEPDGTKESPKKFKLKIDTFVLLSRGIFEVEAIEKMELEILSTLSWRINPPTCVRFIVNLLQLCPHWDLNNDRRSEVMAYIYDVSRYLSELSVCVPSFAFTYTNSTIAYASICCALETLPNPLLLAGSVRVDFFYNMSQATGLFPHMEEVLEARRMLKALCPTVFKDEEQVPRNLPDDRLNDGLRRNFVNDPGNASPISVVNPDLQLI